MNYIKCPDCGEDVILRNTEVNENTTLCKLRIAKSCTMKNPIVIRGQAREEHPTQYEHYYELICDNCEKGLYSSMKYKDITDYVIKNWGDNDRTLHRS